jgi:SET domain-containing protein
MPNPSYLSPKTIVQESPMHGRGLFACAPIPKGEIVAIIRYVARRTMRKS